MEQTKCSETSAYKIQAPGKLPRSKHTTVFLVFTLWNTWFTNNASELSLHLTERTKWPSQILTFNAVYLSNYFLLREPYRHLKHIYIRRTSAQYSGSGQLLIARPWTRTPTLSWNQSALAKQQALKTKMDIWWDALRKRRWTPPRPPPTGTAH